MKALAAIAVAAAVSSGAWSLRYPAELVRVIDSDTYVMTIAVWPSLTVKTHVRLRGVDTPEKFRPSKKCKEHERALSKKATQLVTDLFARATKIYISRPIPGKYGGRVVADVYVSGMVGVPTPVADLLMAEGLAYEYHGGTKNKDHWCSVATRENT